MKNFSLYVGFIAGFLTMVAGMPQVYEVYTTNKTAGINIMFALTYMIGLYLWTYYGYLLNIPAIYVFNLIGAFTWTYITYKIIKNM